MGLTSTATARLRLIVECVTQGSATFSAITAQAQGVASAVNSALNGGGAGGGSGGKSATWTAFDNVREVVKLSREQLETFYNNAVPMASTALGKTLPDAAKVSTGDLKRFYEEVTGLNVELPKVTTNLEKALAQFALWGTVSQIAGGLKRFGAEIVGFVSEGMADSLDKEAALVKAVEGVLINNPDLAATIREGGAQAYKAFSDGIQAQLNTKAITIGLNTTFSDNQVAQGMSILLKSGVDLADVLGDNRGGVADAMAKIAMIGGTDIPTAAKHMISIYNQFGNQLKSQFGGDVPAAFNYVADVITNALGSSGVDLNAFMNSLSYAGTASALAGQSFGDTATILTLFAQNGIAGSKAGTGLRRIITSLTPTTEKAAEAVAAMTAKVGGSADAFYDASGKMKPLVEVQALLAETLATFSPQDQIALVKEIFGQYAIGQALILANAEEFGNLAAQVNQAGTAQRQVNAIMESGPGVADRFTEAVNTLKETMGDTNLNYVTPLKSNIADLIENYLKNASPETQKWINTLIGGTGVLSSVGGSTLQTAANVGMMLAGFELAGISLGGVAATALPVIGIIAAIAAAVGLLYLAWTTNFGGIRDYAEQIWASIGPTIMNAAREIVSTLIGAVLKIRDWWETIAPSVEKAFANVLAFLAYFSPVWTAFWESIKAIVSGAWTIVTGVIGGAWDVISGIFNFFVHLLSGEWDKLWDDLKQIVLGFWKIIVSIFSGLWEAIKGVCIAAWDGLTGMFSKLWDGMTDIATGWGRSISEWWERTWTTIKTMAAIMWKIMSGDWKGALDELDKATDGKSKGVTDKFREMLDNIGKFFKELPGKMWDWAVNAVQMFIDGAKSMITKIAEPFQSIGQTIKNFLGFSSPTKLGPASDSDTWMPNMMNMFIGGINANLPKLATTVAGVAGTIYEGIGNIAPAPLSIPIADPANELAKVEADYNAAVKPLQDRLLNDSTLTDDQRTTIGHEILRYFREYNEKKASIENAAKAGAQASQASADAAGAAWSSATSTAITGASTVAQAGNSLVANLTNSVTTAATQAKAAWQSLWDELTAMTERGMATIAERINARLAALTQTLREFVNGVLAMLSDLNAQAFASGRNFVDMLADGVIASLPRLQSAVAMVAGAIKSYVGFASPTDLGPASDSDKWMPNFVNMLVDGINASRPALQQALGGMAMDMRVGVLGGTSSATGVAMGAVGRGAQKVVYATFVYSGGGRDQFDQFARDVNRVISNA